MLKLVIVEDAAYSQQTDSIEFNIFDSVKNYYDFKFLNP